MAGTYEQAKIGEACSSGDPKILAQLSGMNELLNSENKLGNTLRWYTPTIVSKEDERESTAYGTLTTADEVKSVVLPASGLIVIGFQGVFKSSVSAAGSAAIFIGANQLKRTGVAQSAATSTTETARLSTSGVGLTRTALASPALNTTGEVLASETEGGLCYVFAAAGTYNVSVQFKATSGKVIAKERNLWVGVIGV